MKNKISIAILGIVLLSAFSSCKKDKDEDAKPEVRDTQTGLLKNGSFIEGTVVTATDDDEPVEFIFKYEYLDSEIFFDGGTGGATMGEYLYKDFTDYDDDYADYARVRFELDSLLDKTPSNINFRMYATSNLPENRVFYFDVNDDAVISNYSYDSINHVMSGNFIVNSDNTDNGQDALVSGSFRYENIKKVKFRTTK